MNASWLGRIAYAPAFDLQLADYAKERGLPAPARLGW